MPAPLGIEFGIKYTIIGPTGARAVLNSKEDPDYVGYVSGDEGVTGLNRGEVRQNSELLPGEDGGSHGAFLRGMMPFTLSGTLKDDGGASVPFQDKLLRATAALRQDALLMWEPTTAPPVMTRFREQLPTRISGRRPKRFLVGGISEDPKVYAQAARSVEITPGDATPGGYAFPLEFPLTSSAGLTGAGLVTLFGNADTWPVITLYGPFRNAMLRNDAAGREINITATLAAGERLVLNTDPRRRVIQNQDGANRYRAYDSSRSEWWPLVAGTNGVNTVRLFFDEYNTGARAVVAFRDAWG